MKKYIPFLVFATLVILTIPLSLDNFSPDFATSVVPGWHTTIIPPYLLMNLIVAIILLLVTLAYRKISKKIKKVNWKFFLLHLVLTIPLVFYIIFPSSVENLLIYDEKPIRVSLLVFIMFAPTYHLLLARFSFLFTS